MLCCNFLGSACALNVTEFIGGCFGGQLWLGDAKSIDPFLEAFPNGAVCLVGIKSCKQKDPSYYGYKGEDGDVEAFAKNCSNLIRKTHEHLVAGKTVLVCCQKGISRSPLMLCFYAFVHGTVFPCLCDFYKDLNNLIETEQLPSSGLSYQSWKTSPARSMVGLSAHLCELLMVRKGHTCRFYKQNRGARLQYREKQLFEICLLQLKSLYNSH